jgi:hypothetical protein
MSRLGGQVLGEWKVIISRYLKTHSNKAIVLLLYNMAMLPVMYDEENATQFRVYVCTTSKVQPCQSR